MKTKKENVVLSLSGGMDSSTLLLRCLREYKNVTAISFFYGQKHKVEIEKAQELVKYINDDFAHTIPRNEDDIYCIIKHHIIKLDGLGPLLNSTLVEGGAEVPEGHYEESNQIETVVPNRNKIFASIIQAVALSISKETGEDCDIALGIHANDSTIYPDCRPEFRDADDRAFRLGNWGSEAVHYFTPYLETDKFGILKDGMELCEKLGLNFDEVYSRTITSYKPICLLMGMGSTGVIYEWFSDYKSASSVERIEAFIKLGRPDPTKYADETGPVTWEHVENYFLNTY